MLTTDLHNLKAKFDDLGGCVIITHYTDLQALLQTVSQVLQYTSAVIIVMGEAGNDEASILSAFPGVDMISIDDNKAKGQALRKGFDHVIGKGCKYAITIESDWQYLTDDIAAFINELETERDAIIIGQRQSSDKRTIGDKLSDFWFRIETGVRCTDTHSTFRLYPIHRFSKTKFYTTGYEFEREVLVRAAWSGIAIDCVPVQYGPAKHLAQHKTFADSFRAVLLNTILVVIAFLYIKPRNFIRVLSDFKKLKQAIKEQLFSPHHSASRKAASVAVGVFCGILPIWGFQSLAALGLALLLRLNKVLALIFVHVSLPPLIPLVIFLSYKIGGFWMGDANDDIPLADISLKAIGEHLGQYIFGSITLAVLSSSVAWLITFGLLTVFKKKTAEHF